MRKGFSLLELMVVIGIIGLVTAMIVPYYSDYNNKAKVSLAALVLNNLNVKAMALYNEGQITPGITQVVIDGVTFNDNGWVSVNYSGVNGAMFLAPGDGYIPDNEWMFCVFVAGLSYPGFVNAMGGAYSRLCSKVVVNNGQFTEYCGTWTQVPNGLEVPGQFLPDNCNVAEIDNI